MSASPVRTLLIALIALMFGAQQIACACPPAHEMKVAHDHQAHSSHAFHAAHGMEQGQALPDDDDAPINTCGHCETGSFLNAGADETFTPVLPESTQSFDLPSRTIRLASYSATDSPLPVMRDYALRRTTPLQLKVRLLN